MKKVLMLLMVVGMMVFMGCSDDKDKDDVNYLELTYENGENVVDTTFYSAGIEMNQHPHKMVDYDNFDYRDYKDAQIKDFSGSDYDKINDYDSQKLYHKGKLFTGVAKVYYVGYVEGNDLFAKITYLDGAKNYAEFYHHRIYNHKDDEKIDVLARGYYVDGKRDGEWYIRRNDFEDLYGPYLTYNYGILNID